MGSMQNVINGSQPRLDGEFFKKLSPEALKDLSAMALPSSYPAGKIVYSERDLTPGIYIILEGDVKLSMNSSDGRRLILRIARKGEILGLASALSGKPSEMTAETLYPAKIAPISRRDFQNFLMRHPKVYQTVTEELSREYNVACEQLRTVGLSNSAPVKLARLLLEWSENGKTNEGGTHFRFPLTHSEIGEFIGASRETVTRTMSVFKSRQLVAFHGSMLTISNRTALESYADN
ncbi:MAG TPA: Crp/Fnr family transcriptional regulator [Terracidiphilus sp.]|nr:Crp/Fnr family transcriptional regulator [Terracidiphilus sp.]